MLTMQEYADRFQREHRGKGKVIKVTDYSFWWETLPDFKNPETKTKTTVYMKSYFM